MYPFLQNPPTIRRGVFALRLKSAAACRRVFDFLYHLKNPLFAYAND